MIILGAIETYRDYGETDENIIRKIMEKFNVSEQYVLALLKSQVA